MRRVNAPRGCVHNAANRRPLLTRGARRGLRNALKQTPSRNLEGFGKCHDRKEAARSRLRVGSLTDWTVGDPTVGWYEHVRRIRCDLARRILGVAVAWGPIANGR